MVESVIIYGASATGQRIYENIKHEVNVIAFIDEDKKKWGKSIDNIVIYSPDYLSTDDKYSRIYIGVLTFYSEIMDELKRRGISESKINDSYVSLPIKARNEFLRSLSLQLREQDIYSGAVAEVGVFRGDFAKVINEVFYDRKCYLFDTFEGFSDSDCLIEETISDKKVKTGYFSNTSETLVLSKMKYPQNCIIRKGYFPETILDNEEQFVFVNLDADLYAPTLAGLEYFYPRMLNGGVILVHDYFSQAFDGAKKAVLEYCNTNNIDYMPIGDTLSVAIMKK